MKNYSLSSCQDLINTYVNEFKGEVTELREGVLGLGTILLHSAKGKKTIIINEYFINSWTSGHTIRMYNKIPKKYERALETI
jgi:hypothetical protein